jgi:hypothetical protein
LTRKPVKFGTIGPELLAVRFRPRHALLEIPLPNGVPPEKSPPSRPGLPLSRRARRCLAAGRGRRS